MESNPTAICYGVLAMLFLHGIRGTMQNESFPCSMGNNFNETLNNTIHLSDVVMAGRIISVKEGEFGTFSAVVSYFYAYKSDQYLQRRALWRAEVTNFITRPAAGQLGIFFLFRQPNLELSLFCVTLSSLLKEVYEEDYEEIIDSINALGASDTKNTREFVTPYPNTCDLEPCGSGAYCSIRNTLPQADHRCSCLTGFYRNQTTSKCQPITGEAAASHCTHCNSSARCSLKMEGVCLCDHINCFGVARRPLCGSDGRNYAGECQMKKESCRQQKAIYKLYDGWCNERVPEPCMGIGNPLTTSDGFVQCLDHGVCPTQHFCHSTQFYDVCCPVLEPSSTISSTATTASPSPSITQIQTTPIPTMNDSNCKGSGDCAHGSGSDPESVTMSDDEDLDQGST